MWKGRDKSLHLWREGIATTHAIQLVFGTVEMFLHLPSLTEKGPFTSFFVAGMSAKPFTSYNVMKTRAVTLSSKEKSEIYHPCGKTTQVVLNRQRELLV